MQSVWRYAWILALGAARAASAQVVTEMTPERIREAIADTKAKGCYVLSTGGVLERFGRGCLTTPYSRVVLAAQNAREKYQPFTEADVQPAMLAPEFEIEGCYLLTGFYKNILHYTISSSILVQFLLFFKK